MAKTADHASRASEPRPATGAGQDSRKAMMARAIVEKACTLFSEKGYAGTSLTDIAEALGMTRGAMYYYFSNKEALLESIVEEALVVPLAEIAEWRETASGTAAERLRSFVVGRVRNTLNLQTQMRMLQVTELAMPADLFARYTDFKRKILEEYRALVREGMLNGEFLPVDDRLASSDRIVASLRGNQTVDVETNPQEALFRAAENPYDLIIVSLGLTNYDGLRLCSQLRSLERTRGIPILTVADLEDRPKILRGLDLGVNDYLVRPIDRNELIARVRTQVRRKRYVESLRNNVEQAIEMAVVDALTGLHNRRYFDMHLSSLLDQAAQESKPLSLLVLDIDFFKKINDTYGHDAGDEILRALAGRMRRAVRSVDLVCRLGGEEFVIVMPETALDVAGKVAERVRRAVEAEPFNVKEGQMAVPVTVSIGIADRGSDANPDFIYKSADKALYESKATGRNKVTLAAA